MKRDRIGIIKRVLVSETDYNKGNDCDTCVNSYCLGDEFYCERAGNGEDCEFELDEREWYVWLVYL